MKEIVSTMYEKRVLGQIIKHKIPNHIILVIFDDSLMEKDAWRRLRAFTGWCREIGIQNITFYISMVEAGTLSQKFEVSLLRNAKSTFSDTEMGLAIYTKDEQRQIKAGKPLLNISIGYGGKFELTNSIKEIMKKVEAGEISPDDIDEKLIEKHLKFKVEPDLIIRTNSKQLTDFLIWQAVYSELYFTDVSWRDFRKIDFLRAVRDFQNRQRKFGV